MQRPGVQYDAKRYTLHGNNIVLVFGSSPISPTNVKCCSPGTRYHVNEITITPDMHPPKVDICMQQEIERNGQTRVATSVPQNG
jgi:hypothetical protein